MAVPGSASELQAPRYVCGTCGALFHHTPEACPVCAGFIVPRSEAARPNTHLDRKHRRTLYALAGFWSLVLAAIVVYTAMQDPTLGHAGRTVYPNETVLENQLHGAPPDPSPALRTFRLSKRDRIEKIDGPPEAIPSDVWIRITSGPHAGRTGVIVW